MMPVITAFATPPDRGRGFARDMRVRWALEEVGQAYDVDLVTFAAMQQAGYLALHPFGQIPVWRGDDLVLFESGAIVLHIADTRPGLLPKNAGARGRAIAWMFAALNTIEPSVNERGMALLFERDEPWFATRQATLDRRVHAKLADLARHLGDGAWLDGAFSAGDLLMVSVLRRLGGTDLLAAFPTIAAYVARGEARAAFQRAFAAQLAVFAAGQAAAEDPGQP